MLLLERIQRGIDNLRRENLPAYAVALSRKNYHQLIRECTYLGMSSDEAYKEVTGIEKCVSEWGVVTFRCVTKIYGVKVVVIPCVDDLVVVVPPPERA